MKKKYGFTLIELLAVIVILAVIALIAIPLILNIIESSRKGAAIDATYGYVESVEMYLFNKKYTNLESELVNGENLVENINKHVNLKGTKPKSGKLIINNNGMVNEGINICFYGYSVQYNDNKAYISGKCDNDTIIDKKPCELEKEIIDDKEYLYIDSVEDMYAFSSSVNKGNTYEGKVVKIRNNLDFSKYNNPKVCETNDNEKGFTPMLST